jgi:acyl-coenzyme A synthetase/AMP-(fatty) acid ligase/3-hydroxymyristoyl/3-hydroxydecanoyl-(acyl carrier protein) dehydratase
MTACLSNLLQALAAHEPSSPAGWRGADADAVAVTRGALARQACAWAALLAARPGRHFALYLDDSLEFAAALLGAWQAGKTVWLTADTVEASCAALAGSVDGFIGAFPAALAPLALPAAATPSFLPLRALDLDACALVVHTSGSTGAAQAIPKRLSQLASEVAVLEQMFGAQVHGTSVVATVSHQHIYGLLFRVLWPLCAGRPLYCASAVYPEQLAAMLGQRPAILVGSPAHLKRLPEHLDWSAARSHVRAIFSSGGPLPEDSALACKALLGSAPAEVYGSSESGGVAWRRRESAGGPAAWQPFPNVAWRVARDTGALEVRSPHLPDDGWMTLADRAAAAEGGRFDVLGRVDRIVKIEEKRVSLDALERALAASPLVAEARVIATDVRADAGQGGRTQLAAIAVLTAQGRELLARDGKLSVNRALRALLAGTAPAVALPRRWRYPAQLPYNTQGKTTHAALLALLEQPSGESVQARPRAPQVHELAHGDGSVTLELTIPQDLLYFDGHFDAAPILPGVAQLDWAVGFARRYFAPAGVFRDVAALKFQQVIRPGAVVRLELQHDAGKHSVQFRYASDAGPHASGRIVFSASPD